MALHELRQNGKATEGPRHGLHRGPSLRLNQVLEEKPGKTHGSERR
jgi:hypothetical protein